MNNKKTSTDLNFFIFDPETHGHYVDDFLKNASQAHGHELKSAEWFNWKFFANPFGPTIMACVATPEELIGCVAYGRQPFVIDGQTYEGVLSYETFVNPNYQGQGLFSRLLKFAEEEVRQQGIAVMLNFPNSQSLPGFLKKNWQLLDISAYYLRPRLKMNLLLNFTKIRTPFISLESNLEQIKDKFPDDFSYQGKSTCEGLVTADYVQYRFFKFPHGHYKVYNEDGSFALGRLGKRAALTELQILLINLPELKASSFSKMLKGLLKETNADIVSYPTSVGSVLTGLLKKQFFVKVPNKSNICYKILDQELNIDMTRLELSGINFHTY